MSCTTAGETSEEISDLVSEKMQQLLAAVGSRPMEDTTQTEATEYDWRQPHYFSEDQLDKLDDLTTQIAAVIAERFARLYNSDFNVTIASTTQHFAGELFEQISASGQNDYYLAFGTDQEHLYGFVGIPARSAITLVTQLLGDSESETDASKAFSSLEKSLLLDIASAIVESLGSSLRGYCDIQAAKAVTKSQPPFVVRGVDEFCKIVFAVERAASASEKPGTEAYILIPCDKLGSAVGKTIAPDVKISSQEMSKAIIEHLQQTPVSVTAQLDRTVLTLEELMSLRSGDILLLDKPINEPGQLVVEGQTIFRGQLARSAGKHTVVITAASCDKAQNRDAITGT